MANHFQLDTRGPALKERKKKQEEDALPKIQWRDPRKANSFQTNSFYGKLDILNFWARLLPMMIKHLGDTADYWKGGMIEDLESAGLLSDFAVDPMISDDTDWQSSTFAHYQKLLRINKSQIIVHRKSLQKTVANI